MERIFRQCDIPEEGIISRDQVPSLLQSLHPDFNIQVEELDKLISEHDTDGIYEKYNLDYTCEISYFTKGSGRLDFEAVIKIIFKLLMKQSVETSLSSLNDACQDRLCVEDFIIFNNP
jgi:hypothetical protein